MLKKGQNQEILWVYRRLYMYMLSSIVILSSALLVLMLPVQSEGNTLRQLRIPTAVDNRKTIETWQEEVHKKLSKIVSLPDQKPTSFETEKINEEMREGYKLEEFKIQSTLQRSIHVCVGVPLTDKPKKFPAVVCIHGHGGNRYTAFEKEPTPYHEFGKRLLENGYIVITTDVGQHDIYEQGRTLIGERLWDLIRCVDYLETLPFVDANRIGCAGLSLGGEMAMWLGAIDTRIKATAVCGFLTYMDQMEKNHCMCWKFEGLRELVDFPDIYAMMAPRALQCQNGEKEPPDQFPPSLAQKGWSEIISVYRVFNAENQAELIIHSGGHEIAIKPLIVFFEKHLKGQTTQTSRIGQTGQVFFPLLHSSGEPIMSAS
ncbi:MAG TPA: alpha/beta hydrolase family protein [Candidatus Hydrogenedens sp.]|nr:alpha/beta hydrolase family protein [Candidatus Hydrogenedens sp.]HPP59030.1 alpha/beta hydrolase family protein [Candidatus Hydrogenedens sp.]